MMGQVNGLVYLVVPAGQDQVRDHIAVTKHRVTDADEAVQARSNVMADLAD